MELIAAYRTNEQLRQNDSLNTQNDIFFN
jgi:hypothetical protein